jgi:hypothetical protein
MTTATAPILNGDASASVVAIPTPARRGKRAAAVPAAVAATPLTDMPADPVLALIERMARDPSVDPAKVKEFLDMRREAEREANERAFNEALAKAQGEMEPIAADARNPETNSRYASYAQLDRAIRPIYTKCGFALTFTTGRTARPEEVDVIGFLIGHGFSREYTLPMAADGKGPKGGAVMSRTHATGSAITYGKRYLLGMIFNIAVASKDDDGNAAGRAGGAITAEQAKRIAVKADMRRFCDFLGVPSIGALPAARFEHAIASLAAKGSKTLATPSIEPTNAQRALAARAGANGRG